MKKALLLCFSAWLLASYAMAQDIIIMRNGDEVEAKVTALTDSDISYKKWSNQDGPTYTTAKSKVFMIKYKNGDKDVFKEEAPAPAATAPQEAAAPKYEIGLPDEERNNFLLNFHNTDAISFIGETETDKKAEGALCQYFVTEDSQLANKDIEISVFPSYKFYAQGYSSHPCGWVQARYVLEISITNRTDKPVYVDLGNTFLSDDSGKSTSHYTPSSTSNTQGRSGGASVNLGGVARALGVGGAVGTIASGVNVGGGKSSSSTTVTYAERIIRIAPNSKVTLEKKHSNTLTRALVASSFHRGEVFNYTKEESNSWFDVYVTYSLDEKFTQQSVLKAKYYMGKSIGAKTSYSNFLREKDFNIKDEGAGRVIITKLIVKRK